MTQQPGTASTMPGAAESADSKARVAAAWRAFGSRDAATIAAVLTPDAEWLAPPQNATAMAIDGNSHLVGRERIIRFLVSEFHEVFTAPSMSVRSMLADGTTVVTETTFRATLPNGGAYENDYCFIFELRDGLVHRVREYMDTRRGAELFARDRAAAG